MTKPNDVYNYIWSKKDELLSKFIYKYIKNKQDAEDFFQDIFIILSQKNPSMITRIYDEGDIMRYVYMIIKNNLYSSTSKYYYTYIKPKGSFLEDWMVDNLTEDSNEEKHQIALELSEECDILLMDIDKYLQRQVETKPKKFYDRDIFNLYYNEDCSYRDISSQYDIPHTSIFHTVSKTRKEIESHFKDRIENIKSKIIYYNSL